MLDALLAAGDLELGRPSRSALTPSLGPSAGFPTRTVESFKAAETFLRKVLEKPFPGDRGRTAHRRGARRSSRSPGCNRKIATLDEDTIERLRIVARTARAAAVASQQRNALAALIAARAVDADTLEIVLAATRTPRSGAWRCWRSPARDRRSTTTDRVGYIRKALSDTSLHGSARSGSRAGPGAASKEHGCQPLLDAL